MPATPEPVIPEPVEPEPITPSRPLEPQPEIIEDITLPTDRTPSNTTGSSSPSTLGGGSASVGSGSSAVRGNMENQLQLDVEAKVETKNAIIGDSLR